MLKHIGSYSEGQLSNLFCSWLAKDTLASVDGNRDIIVTSPNCLCKLLHRNYDLIVTKDKS